MLGEDLNLLREANQRMEDIFIRREHLKRQYLRYYKMEKVIKDRKKSDQISRIKRQILHMMARD